MVVLRRAPTVALAALAALVFVMLLGRVADAATFLAGTVTSAGKPVAGARVTAYGNNLTLHAQTDAGGRFRIGGVPSGQYTVDVSATAGIAALSVEVPAAGTTITVALTTLKEIGRTSVSSRPPVTGSGTDLTLGPQQLAHSPAGGSLPDLLVQLPGAARGANGVVHLNGDHGDINYIIDGVEVPQALNRVIGSEVDPNDIASVQVLQGAYPAKYGERFAAVLDISTLSGSGPSGFSTQFDGGSYADLNAEIAYHANVGKGSFIIATKQQQSERGLDPPNPDSPHDNFSDSNAFARLTEPLGTNFLNFTVSHSYQTFQIPNAINDGEPPTTDDNETQDDSFASVSFRHPIGDTGVLTFGPSFKRSRIRDFGDPANDFAYGIAGNPGSPTDCANAIASTGPIVNGVVTNPVANLAVPYGISTCGFSLRSDRTADDVVGNLDYENRVGAHEVALGGLYDATHVNKTYDVTLQPGNFLAPIFAPTTPGAPYTVVDSAPNVGHLAALYVQDTWELGRYKLDYGLRNDIFLVGSTQFDRGFSQTSPRVKLTYDFSRRDSVYAFYGRFFTPFSLENVSPTAAYTLNLPLQSQIAGFDLKPQRDSDYEIGGHFGVGAGDLGIRVMQKDATDLIDDTQVGNTNLHQDINYAQGRIATQTAYYQYTFRRSSRFYFSATHTYSVNKGCETQLLAPCFGSTTDWYPADHDQRVDINSGLTLNDAKGGWVAVDGEYGSGLSSGLNPSGGITCAGPGYLSDIGGPCKFTPHVTFDVEKGIAMGPGVVVTLRMRNVLNDLYEVTYLNAQGNHYAPPRTFQVGVRIATP